MPLTGTTGNVAVVFDWLKDIAPISVEAERVFSTVGNFVTKLQSRMNDTLDDPVFFKTYYNGHHEVMRVCNHCIPANQSLSPCSSESQSSVVGICFLIGKFVFKIIPIFKYFVAFRSQTC